MKKTHLVLSAFLGGALLVSVAYNISQHLELQKNKKAAAAVAEVVENTPEVTPAAAKTAAKPETKPEAKKKLQITRAEWTEDYSYYAGGRKQMFQIKFNAAVADGAFESGGHMIEITPAVDNFSVSALYDSKTIDLSGAFKSNMTYKVTVKKGLRPANPERFEPLEEERILVFRTGRLNTKLRFKSRGMIYPLHAPVFELPVQVEHSTGKVQAEVRQVYANRLIDFLNNNGTWLVSRALCNADFPVLVKDDESTVAALDLAKAGVPRKPGFYTVELSMRDGASSYGGSVSSRVRMVLTDLGISVTKGAKEYLAAVTHLQSGKPVTDAQVQLYDTKQQVLFTGKTDANGFCRIDRSVVKAAQDKDPESYVNYLIVSKGDDTSYTALDFRDFSKLPADPSDNDCADFAMVFGERDICRPGETFTAFAMLRNGTTRAARAKVPVEWIVRNSNWQVISKGTTVTDEHGFMRYSIAIPADAPLGSYRISLSPAGTAGRKAALEYGGMSFLVEEYVPDELRMTAATDFDAKTGKLSVKTSAKYYFGVPLKDGDADVNVWMKAGKFVSKAFPAYVFAPETPAAVFNWKDGKVKGKLNANGEFKTDFVLPKLDKTVSPVDFYAVINLQKASGGRTLTTVCKTWQKHDTDYYLGLKEEASDKTGNTYSVAAVTPDDKSCPVPADLKFKVTRFVWDYVEVKSGGSWYHEWQRIAHPVTLNDDSFKVENGKFKLNLPTWGEYELVITDRNGGIRHKQDFWFWAGEAGERVKNPAVLAFDLDKEQYLPGDTVTLTFASSVQGAGLLVFGGPNVDGQFRFEAKKGTNVLKFQIPATQVRGYYAASVTVVGKRKDDDLNQQRLSGLAELKVDQTARKLLVELSAPETAEPNQTVSVKVVLKNAKDKTPVSGSVQLWAVDAGILALTGYKTPDPYEFIFGAYASGLEVTDNYGKLFSLSKIERKLIGGGMSAAALQSQRREERKAPAIVLLDTVRVSASGEATATMKLPDHTGALRIIAVAGNDIKAGSGDREITTHYPISLKADAPRVLAPGDTFRFTFDAFNQGFEAGKAVWSVDGLAGAELSGGQTLKGELSLAKGGSASQSLTFTVKPDAEKVAFDLHLSMNGKTVTEKFAVTVRDALPEATVSAVEMLKAGETKTLTVNGKFDTVSVGSPALYITGALEYLNGYPYGCLEQTVSAAFPFLAVKPLVKAGLLEPVYEADAAGKIKAARDRILNNRVNGPWCSMWQGGYKQWTSGSLYAWMFLLEADAAGYDLNLGSGWKEEIDAALCNMLSQNGNLLTDRVTGIYVLSFLQPAKAADHAAIYLETERDLSSFQQFLLAAAMIRGGRAADGMKVLKPLLENHCLLVPDRSLSASGFYSRERQFGLTLWVLCGILPDSPEATRLAVEICKSIRTSGHWGSTQSNAWCVLGLSRWAQKDAAGPLQTTITDGKNAPVKLSGGVKRFTGARTLTIANQGTAPVYVFRRERVRQTEFKAESNGFGIRKTYLDKDGKAVLKAKNGDLLTVKIELTGAGETMDNLVICDLLPAGLEIEDPTLRTRMKFTEKHGGNAYLETFRERRFDRFLSFGSLEGEKTAELTYQVRAVTRGKFALPPVQIESMYTPELKAAARPGETFEVE